jgi:Zn finger protein HypA/HybF involved in hydrogenase expression
MAFRTSGVTIRHGDLSPDNEPLPRSTPRHCDEAVVAGRKRLIQLVSAITCHNCQQTVWSRSVHDYHPCQCGQVAIDGGRSYTRIVGNEDDFTYSVLWLPFVKGVYEMGTFFKEEA